MNKYGVMYWEGWAGVIRYNDSGTGYSWVMPTEFTAHEAEKMVSILNDNPNLNEHDLMTILEAA